MKLYSINTGYFKLDGGAMFGVVPKSLWSKVSQPDDNNMCTWAMRCLLIEEDNNLILIDNGIGNKQDNKFFSRYYLHGEDTLCKSLQSLDFSVNDITIAFLTHLHFDHCGGSIEWNENKSSYRPSFPNAKYLSNSNHWEWAFNSNKRESASFLKENIIPIQESGQLAFVQENEIIIPGMQIIYKFGHTVAMMLPKITYKGITIVFMADLIPSAAHINLPYVMAYDSFPNVTLQEKEIFLNEAAENDYVLFFEHDPINECARIEITERGIGLKKPSN